MLTVPLLASVLIVIGSTAAAAATADMPEPRPTAEQPSSTEPAAEPSDEPALVDAEPTPSKPTDTPKATQETADPPSSRVADVEVDHTGSRYEGPGGVVYYVPDRVAVGEPIHISGTGWTTAIGDAGSVIGVKLDEGAVSTRLEVTNPATGAVQGNKTIIGVVQADADGEWEVSLPFPTLETSDHAWEAGQTHSVRLLTGSLLAGDVTRTVAASFTIGDDSPDVTEPPVWPHQTVTYTDPATGRVATAWIESAVAAGDTSRLRVKGAGWVDATGTRASTVALKLNSGPGTQYTRTGADIVQHPTASGDDTIWALLAKADGTDRPHVFPIDDTGSFEVTLDAPRALVTGQYLTTQLQSGRFLSGDVQRTVVSAPLVVGGVPWSGGGTDEQVTCVPTTSAPTVRIESPSVAVGGALHVTGTGWCHPGEKGGGSVIAFKIDEGAYSRLSTAVHQNRTIWAVAAADAATGDLDAVIQLPDGTTSGASGSDPAFTTGSHTLRLLSGSLKVGDTVRTLESAEFVVGAYQPNGVPPLMEYREDLTKARAGGVTVTRSSSAVTVMVPGAVKDDWIFLTAYASDGSPRYPWGATWFHANAAGKVKASLSGATLPVGTSKLAVQSGNRGELGRLIGWDHLTVPDPSKKAGGKAKDKVKTAPKANPSVAPVIAAPAAGAAPAVGAPTGVPAPPVATGDGLTPRNAGGVTGVQDGTIVTITIPSAEPGDWVYLYAYSTPTPVGWIEVDAVRQVKVDVSTLPTGMHRIAVLDRDGALIGWTSATVTATESDVPGALMVTPPVAALTGAGGWMGTHDWWLLSAGLIVLLAACGAAVQVRRTRPAAAEGGQR